MMDATNNPNCRRRFPRIEMYRPAKLFDARAQRYCPGRTCNLSSGGALLELRAASHLSPGDEISLAVEWPDQRHLLRQYDLQHATVVRIQPGEFGSHYVAVEFHRATGLPLAA